MHRIRLFRVLDLQNKIYLEGYPEQYKYVHPDDGELYDIGLFFSQPQRFHVQERLGKDDTSIFRLTDAYGKFQTGYVYEGDVFWDKDCAYVAHAGNSIKFKFWGDASAPRQRHFHGFPIAQAPVTVECDTQ